MTNKQLLINFYNKLKEYLSKITNNTEIIQFTIDGIFKSHVQSCSPQMHGHKVEDPCGNYTYVSLKYDETTDTFYAIDRYNINIVNINASLHWEFMLSDLDIELIKFPKLNELIDLYQTNDDWEGIIKNKIIDEYFNLTLRIKSNIKMLKNNLLIHNCWSHRYLRQLKIDELWELWLSLNSLYYGLPEYLSNQIDIYFNDLKQYTEHKIKMNENS